MQTTIPTIPDPPSLRRVVATWWPLAISWILMSAEPAALAAVVARLPNPNIHLAAYGSVTFPLIGIIQSPILTLLSLSTAMSKDWDSFLKGRRVMFSLGLSLTLLYIVITFTPLFDFIVTQLIGAPQEILEPARQGMYVGIPWAFAVAYRRFHQGVMIRFEHSRSVTVGTLLRFAADAIVLYAAYRIYTIPGTVVAVAMMVVGVVTEAVYVGWRVRPVLRYEVKTAPSLREQVLLRDMVRFFIPLAIMPLMGQLIRPIGSAAISRMPNPLEALAIWPVITSLSFLIVTPGSAYNEVVIAMLDRPGAKRSLMRFLYILMGSQLSVMLLMAFTPLAGIWFGQVSGLEPDLARKASAAFALLIPSSLISPLNSWFTGAILHSRRSRYVTEGMVVYLSVYVIALAVGGFLAASNPAISGLYIAIISSIVSSIAQTGWLAFRARGAVGELDRE